MELSQDLKEYLENFAKNIKDEWQWEGNMLQYLRAIVSSGEASSSAMNELRYALSQLLPDYQDNLRTSLDPNFLTAFGGAKQARRFFQDREFMQPDCPSWVLPLDHSLYWGCVGCWGDLI